MMDREQRSKVTQRFQASACHSMIREREKRQGFNYSAVLRASPPPPRAVFLGTGSCRRHFSASSASAPPSSLESPSQQPHSHEIANPGAVPLCHAQSHVQLQLAVQLQWCT